jgi:hypothetical protein
MLKILSGHIHLIPGGSIFQHKFIGFIELIGIGEFLGRKETLEKGFLPRVSPRTLLEEDRFTGSPSNGRRESPPALPLLQGAFSHEFIT